MELLLPQWSYARFRLSFTGRSRRRGHFGVEIEELFQALGIVFEAATDINALQHFVVALMRLAQIRGHVIRIVELRHSRWVMGFAGQDNFLRAACEVSPIFLGELRQ